MLLFADGFDGEYSATADLTKVWANNTSTSNITYISNGGKFSGGCVQAVTSGSLFSPVPPNLSSLTSTVFNCAFWFTRSAKPGGNVFPFGMLIVSTPTGANGTGFNTFGQMICMNGPVVITGGNSCDGVWHWFEETYPITTSSQTAQMWLDGVRAGQATGTPTNQNSVVYGIILSGVDATAAKFDDVICWNNDTGVTGDLTTASLPIGPQRCRGAFQATGAGTFSQWTPLSGTNASNIDETPPNDDTDYVQASSSGLKDTYAFGGSIVPSTDTSPLMVNVKARLKNADAGSINVQGVAYNGSATGTATTKQALSAYQMNHYPMFRDPAGATWTAANINANEYGIQIP